jgi:sodium-dependent dicarboxylate transporter 2/3/5
MAGGARTSFSTMVGKGWRSRMLWLLPLLLSPLLFFGAAARCGFVALLMAAFWSTEALPPAITALLPLALFPLLGVAPADKVSRAYFQDKVVLFFGGLVLAAGLEVTEVHRRIALAVLRRVGTSPPRLVLGFLLATALLSMWLSNTATAAMMLPIASAILGGGAGGARRPPTALGKALSLAVAYGANIGGMATLTGTGPNVVLSGALPALFPRLPPSADLSFAKWLGFALPLCAALLAATFATLWLRFLRDYDERGPRARGRGGGCQGGGEEDGADFEDSARLLARLPAQGALTWRQGVVLADFALLATLWMTRHPGFVAGWGDAFAHGYVSDSTAAIAVTIPLFALPAEPPAELLAAWAWLRPRLPPACSSRAVPFEHLGDGMAVTAATAAAAAGSGALVVAAAAGTAGTADTADTADTGAGSAGTAGAAGRGGGHARRRTRVLEWDEVSAIFPWGVIVLLGGGFALAEGCRDSGLSEAIGEALAASGDGAPIWAVALLVSAVVAVLTEVASNVATASIFLPVVASLAVRLGQHPLYLMLPATLACSFAFCLPVATPPNALAFAAGQLRVSDMIATGIYLNVIALLLGSFVLNTSGVALFGLQGLPPWANATAT